MSSRPPILRYRLRIAIQFLALLAAILLTLPQVSLPWQALSPFIALASALTLRSAGLLTLLALPVLALVYFRRRWFCRRLCPVGFLTDRISRLLPNLSLANPHPPRVGQFIALLTLAGALAGYPILLWLDPLSIFSAFFGSWHRPFTLASAIAGLTLPLILLLGVLFSNLWCRHLCPLGATQDLLARPHPGHPPSPARRIFLFSALGLAAAYVFRRDRHSNPTLLRPPGSANPDQFTGLCIRCGNCIRVCPSKILQPDLNPSLGFMTPVAHFDNDYCREDCNRCGLSCPSAAIARLTLDQKSRQLIGLPSLDLNTCLLANGQDCTACIRACPYHALSVASVEDGFGSAPRLDTSKCNGCGACQAVCPARPSRAIRVHPIPFFPSPLTPRPLAGT